MINWSLEAAHPGLDCGECDSCNVNACCGSAADMWSFGTLLRIMINWSLEAAHPGLDCGELGGSCGDGVVAVIAGHVIGLTLIAQLSFIDKAQA